MGMKWENMVILHVGGSNIGYMPFGKTGHASDGDHIADYEIESETKH